MTLVFEAQNAFDLDWTLTDADGEPVNDAVVTATLFSGRSEQSPETSPGDPIEDFTDVELEYVADSDGLYTGRIPATFGAAVGGDYITVVEASREDELFGHWEIPSMVMEKTN